MLNYYMTQEVIWLKKQLGSVGKGSKCKEASKQPRYPSRLIIREEVFLILFTHQFEKLPGV